MTFKAVIVMVRLSLAELCRGLLKSILKFKLRHKLFIAVLKFEIERSEGSF